MFDQYVKLFNIDWFDAWLIEALAIIAGAFVLVLIISKVMETFNRE